MSRRTTRRDLVRQQCRLCVVGFETTERKNADYGAEADGLANFRLAGRVAGITTAQAVAARLADKVHRLGRAAAGELRRRDDDLVDAHNLVALLGAALRERRRR